MLASAGKPDLRGEWLHGADHVDLRALQGGEMIGRVRNIDELNVLVGIDALLEECAAHVNVLRVTSGGGNFQGLSIGLCFCDEGFEGGPILARQRELVG